MCKSSYWAGASYVFCVCYHEAIPVLDNNWKSHLMFSVKGELQVLPRPFISIVRFTIFTALFEGVTVEETSEITVTEALLLSDRGFKGIYQAVIETSISFFSSLRWSVVNQEIVDAKLMLDKVLSSSLCISLEPFISRGNIMILSFLQLSNNYEFASSSSRYCCSILSYLLPGTMGSQHSCKQ